MGEYDARLDAAELQQWMTDEVRQAHHAEMVKASAALDAAATEIERLRALLPPGA